MKEKYLKHKVSYFKTKLLLSSLFFLTIKSLIDVISIFFGDVGAEDLSPNEEVFLKYAGFLPILVYLGALFFFGKVLLGLIKEFKRDPYPINKLNKKIEELKPSLGEGQYPALILDKNSFLETGFSYLIYIQNGGKYFYDWIYLIQEDFDNFIPLYLDSNDQKKLSIVYQNGDTHRIDKFTHDLDTETSVKIKKNKVRVKEIKLPPRASNLRKELKTLKRFLSFFNLVAISYLLYSLLNLAFFFTENETLKFLIIKITNNAPAFLLIVVFAPWFYILNGIHKKIVKNGFLFVKRKDRPDQLRIFKVGERQDHFSYKFVFGLIALSAFFEYGTKIKIFDKDLIKLQNFYSFFFIFSYSFSLYVKAFRQMIVDRKALDDYFSCSLEEEIYRKKHVNKKYKKQLAFYRGVSRLGFLFILLFGYFSEDEEIIDSYVFPAFLTYIVLSFYTRHKFKKLQKKYIDKEFNNKL